MKLFDNILFSHLPSQEVIERSYIYPQVCKFINKEPMSKAWYWLLVFNRNTIEQSSREDICSIIGVSTFLFHVILLPTILFFIGMNVLYILMLMFILYFIFLLSQAVLIAVVNRCSYLYDYKYNELSEVTSKGFERYLLMRSFRDMPPLE